jgi:AcrR family transcriptional regulator
LFNRHGFEGVTIDTLMAHAGLTRGGFYRHFRSKGDVYVAALEDALHRPLHGIGRDCTSADIGRTLINAYLSSKHLETVEAACPLVTLPSDVARADPAVKRVFQSVFVGMSDLLRRGIRGARRADDRQRALAATAMCIGSMTVSRAFPDRELGDAVRGAARRFALELCGLDDRAATPKQANGSGAVAGAAKIRKRRRPRRMASVGSAVVSRKV